MRDPFRYFKTSPEIIRLAVMIHIRFPLSWRSVEDLLHERGIDIKHETVRSWRNRFGPLFAKSIRRRRVQSSVHNHFNLERHFYRREEFKENPSVALAEWRQVVA